MYLDIYELPVVVDFAPEHVQRRLQIQGGMTALVDFELCGGSAAKSYG
jgi:hypothetical protein